MIAPAIVASAILSLGAPAQTNLEPPVATYVYADADLETDEGRDLAEVAKEVGKKLERRKKKFEIVESADEAEVVVELLRLWEEESANQAYQPMNTNDPDRAPINQYLAIGKVQLAEIEIRVGEETPARLTASRPGRRAKDVADGVRSAVELYLTQFER